MAPFVDEGGNAVHPDWSQLHSDLLRLIAGRITHFSDFIRFRSVCRRWRFAGDPNLLCPQPPLLLLPREPASDKCTFFSLSTGALHDVSLPTVAGQEIISAAHGWLVLLDDLTHRVLSLLNPVTGAVIGLPPTKDFEAFCSLFVRSPILTSSPGADDCFVIVLNVYEQRDLVAWCRPGDEEWAVLKTGENPCDILYHEGLFLSIHEYRGTVFASDAATPEKPVEMPSLKAPKVRKESRYAFSLVKTEEGVFLWGWSYKLLSHFYRCRLYKSNLGGLPKWSQIKSIGDNALFDSTGRQTLMCCLKDFPEIEKDCVYSTSSLISSPPEDHRTKKLYVVDLEDGRSGKVLCEWKKRQAYGGEPVWVTLSLL